jgi:hypothetical protein
VERSNLQGTTCRNLTGLTGDMNESIDTGGNVTTWADDETVIVDV